MQLQKHWDALTALTTFAQNVTVHKYKTIL